MKHTNLSHKQKAERRAQMAAAVANGGRAFDVAAQFGVSEATVRNACAENGVIHVSRKQKAEQRKQMAAQVADGQRVSDVAAQVGVTEATVRNACAANGVIRLSHKLRSVRRRLIAQAVANGAAFEDIALCFGVTRQTAAKACREHNVGPLKSRRRRPMKPQKLPMSTYAIIGDLCGSDDTLETIGQRYGVSRQRVEQIHKKAVECGIPVRPPRKRGRPCRKMQASIPHPLIPSMAMRRRDRRSQGQRGRRELTASEAPNS